MIETNQMVPMKYNSTTNVIRECLKFYFKEMWIQDIDENLKFGYEEMGQINVTLAEIGLEQDISDLIMYESMLIGREKLWWFEGEIYFMQT